MQDWATLLYHVGIPAIAWFVCLAPAVLWLMGLRRPAFSFPVFRALVGILLTAGMVGFAGVHWNGTGSDPVEAGVRFTNVADARAFGTALVVLSLATAFTMVLELRSSRLSPGTRAGIVAADLFLLGVFAGIAVATSGWADTPFPKSFWTFMPVGLLLSYLIRFCFRSATHPESRAETPGAAPTSPA